MTRSRPIAALASCLLLCSALFAQYKYTPPEKLNDGIRVGTLKDAGLDEAKITAGTEEILKGTYPNIHSLLIFRHGRLVYENYFSGNDEERGVGKIGVVTHTGDMLHDMRSVTKSVVALALLHAVTHGKIKSLDERVFDIFPEYAALADGDKKLITIRHLLTMSAGLEWDENISYADPKNSEIQMDKAADPIEFVLSQKLVAKPGTVFNYSGGLSQVLAEIVRKKTGMSVDEYAAKNVFTPLGISSFKWVHVNGRPSAASGLRLRSRDMAKLGLLVMYGGKWNGKQLISASLIADASKKQMTVTEDKRSESLPWIGYGYQMWLESFKLGDSPRTVVFFNGNGGQVAVMDRANDTMTVVTAGNYNMWGLKKGSRAIYPEIVFPAIKP